MACLPETEEKEKQMGETAGVPERTGRFAAGFLTGIVTALICMAVFSFGWFAARGVRLRTEKQTDAEHAGAEVLTDEETLYKLSEIQQLIEETYLGEIDGETLSSQLFKGIAAGLEDDYADYYSAAELQSVLDASRGAYYGIGATLSQALDTGEIRVAKVYEDSPAMEGGLQEGDLLLEIDGVSAADMELTEVVSRIKSSEEPFSLTVFREGQDGEVTLTLACDEVTLVHVTYEMKENQIGYISIAEFSEEAVGQFEEALKVLLDQGMEKLIVDLRGNPGGLLDSVCEMLDQVLPKGLIVYTEDGNGNREEFKSDGKRLIDCEMAVLVNGYSASASEIFAGAVQDYGIGPVIGTKTYGKGVVQKTYPLSDGSAFKLTVEKYYTPKGQDINGYGITPDILVEEPRAPSQEDTDPVLEKAMEVMNQ